MGKVCAVIKLHGAEEVIPKLPERCVGCSPMQGHENRLQAREGAGDINQVLVCRVGGLKLGDEGVVGNRKALT